MGKALASRTHGAQTSMQNEGTFLVEHQKMCVSPKQTPPAETAAKIWHNYLTLRNLAVDNP